MQTPLIVQKRLTNHPSVAGLGPAGLCTARVVTTRSPEAMAPTVLLAAFRMPTGESVADNFAIGGLACAIDLETGALGSAVRKKVALTHVDVDLHPDTGVPIKGFRLPFWEHVHALAVCAHEAFPEFPSIGWDIALTADGPVVLEGNYNWDVVLAQQAGSRPLGATGWAEHTLSWLHHATSHHQVPAMT